MITEWLTPLLSWLGIGLDTLILIVIAIAIIVKGD